MAAGEYISMQSQRELFERQIALERAELEAMPEEEQAELAAVYRSKGFTDHEATTIANRIFAHPETPSTPSSARSWASIPTSSARPGARPSARSCAFAVGAVIPVLPFVVGAGGGAFWAAIVASLAALFVVGAGVSLLTGRSLLFSGHARWASARLPPTVTYFVGTVLGVTVGA